MFALHNLQRTENREVNFWCGFGADRQEKLNLNIRFKISPLLRDEQVFASVCTTEVR